MQVGFLGFPDLGLPGKTRGSVSQQVGIVNMFAGWTALAQACKTPLLV